MDIDAKTLYLNLQKYLIKYYWIKFYFYLK